MLRSYSLVEPHPQAPPSSRLTTGRGGAGNYTTINTSRLTPGANATGPASRTFLTSPTSASSSRYLSGRGGAGNIFNACERTIFSFDEELEYDQRLADGRAPVISVGRGGSGNHIAAPRTTRPAYPYGLNADMHNEDYGIGGAGTRLLKIRQSSAGSDVSLSSNDSNSTQNSSTTATGIRKSLGGVVRKMAPRGSFVGKVARE